MTLPSRLVLVGLLLSSLVVPSISWGQSTAFVSTTARTVSSWPTVPSLPRWPLLPNFISGSYRPRTAPVYVSVPSNQCPAGSHLVTMGCTTNYPNSSCQTYCAADIATRSSTAFVSTSSTQGTSHATVWQSQTPANNGFTYYVQPTPYPAYPVMVPSGQCPAGTEPIPAACTLGYPNQNCVSTCRAVTTISVPTVTTRPPTAFVPTRSHRY
jgi:hypothetical protein